MKHEVDVLAPECVLGNADFEFSVRKDGQALGKLKVSKGAVVWVPRDCTLGYKVAWKEFAALLEANGTREN